MLCNSLLRQPGRFLTMFPPLILYTVKDRSTISYTAHPNHPSPPPSFNKPLSCSSVSSQLISIDFITSTLPLLLTNNCVTNQKLYPFRKNPNVAHAWLGMLERIVIQRVRQRVSAAFMVALEVLLGEDVGVVLPDMLGERGVDVEIDCVIWVCVYVYSTVYCVSLFVMKEKTLIDRDDNDESEGKGKWK